MAAMGAKEKKRTKVILGTFALLIIGWVVFSSFFLSSRNAEALKVGKEHFSNKVLECNGKHYVQGKTIIELEDFEYYVKSIELSEVDRRNGIEWAGTVSFSADVYRELKGKQWSDFHEWETSLKGLIGLSGISLELIKKNGKWSVLGSPHMSGSKDSMQNLAISMNYHRFDIPDVKFTCDNLPK
jgi:hypothetical protein